MSNEYDLPTARVGLVWRGDPNQPAPAPAETRFSRIFEEFAAVGVVAEPVIYDEQQPKMIRDRLLGMDGVLVWVDPIVAGKERSALDDLLRDVAERGVYVSAHPDIIQKMGTKRILYDTRAMPWGTDTECYHDPAELIAGSRIGCARDRRSSSRIEAAVAMVSGGSSLSKLRARLTTQPSGFRARSVGQSRKRFH
jgi:hypothetical protein